MSNIQDMNNRIAQNRNQRPSKRPKFKENNRKGIYSSVKKKERPDFKTIPKKELKKIKKQIVNQLAAERKKEQIILGVTIACGLIILIGILLWLN
ncbi:MAG: hypothetical protein AAF969_04510 [Bacteroidota bacterium]